MISLPCAREAQPQPCKKHSAAVQALPDAETVSMQPRCPEAWKESTLRRSVKRVSMFRICCLLRQIHREPCSTRHLPAGLPKFRQSGTQAKFAPAHPSGTRQRPRRATPGKGEPCMQLCDGAWSQHRRYLARLKVMWYIPGTASSG